ncbi:MAG: hypothetical protein ABI604_18860 [Nitrospirota bacterium]
MIGTETGAPGFARVEYSAIAKHRGVASALVLIEPRLRRIKGYRHLPLLGGALQAEIGSTEKSKGVAVA